MRDKDFNSKILGIQSPWRMVDVELALNKGEINVFVEQESGGELSCPQCGHVCTGYDKRTREWRHLDTCQYKTILAADVPRIECPEHGVLTMKVHWEEPGSGFNGLFEALIID